MDDESGDDDRDDEVSWDMTGEADGIWIWELISETGWCNGLFCFFFFVLFVFIVAAFDGE